MQQMDPYLRRVVRQVEEQRDALHTAVLLEIPREEATCLQIHTHGTENNGEVIVVVIVYALGRLSNQTGLSANLSGDFVVRQTGSGEDGNLLATGDGVHGVNSGDSGGDHFLRVHLCPIS
jgi:hypothetical protein